MTSEGCWDLHPHPDSPGFCSACSGLVFRHSTEGPSHFRLGPREPRRVSLSLCP